MAADQALPNHPSPHSVSSESYPWFPAVVFEDDDDEVPKHVVGGRRPAEAFYSPGPVHLVRFYDDTWFVSCSHSIDHTRFNERCLIWGLDRSWLPVSKLKPLGEDKGESETIACHRISSSYDDS